MKKICIVGAGPAGLHLACELAQAGHEVHVFEKRTQCEATEHHNWPDSVELNMLYWAGLPVPKIHGSQFYGEGVKQNVPGEGLYFPKVPAASTLFSPDFSQYAKSFGGLNAIVVDRKALSVWQMERAKDMGVHLHFSSRSLNLLGTTKGTLADIDIHGVAVEEQGSVQEYHCDIVVDATGVASALRTQLGDHRISRPFAVENCLDTYRTVRCFEGTEAVPEVIEKGIPPFSNSGHMLDGRRGYVWMTFLADDHVDIGCCVARKDTEKPSAKEIVEEVAGKFCERLADEPAWEGGGLIAADDPPEALVANGFAVVGDSASMAHPGNGCGVAGAMMAGSMLAKVIDQAPDCTIRSLWTYAKQWNSVRGAAYVASIPRDRPLTTQEINALYEDNMMAGLSAAGFGTESFSLKQVRAAQKYPELAQRMIQEQKQTQALFAHYANYPMEWDKETFERWSDELAALKA